MRRRAGGQMSFRALRRAVDFRQQSQMEAKVVNESPRRKILERVLIVLAFMVAASMLVADYAIDKLAADRMHEQHPESTYYAFVDAMATYGLPIAAITAAVIIIGIGARRIRTRRRKRY